MAQIISPPLASPRRRIGRQHLPLRRSATSSSPSFPLPWRWRSVPTEASPG